eukprot:TRINITY_DN10929_c0_g1_i1.p1 TRINITY_DN10929_c0_g1~~TRINITY_DN10929_c0_g1_i1.p1  ORF type:complete len:273 (-),score=31.36 TRINITY_DN10929_c0_g1_i1:172-990(-)
MNQTNPYVISKTKLFLLQNIFCSPLQPKVVLTPTTGEVAINYGSLSLQSSKTKNEQELPANPSHKSVDTAPLGEEYDKNKKVQTNIIKRMKERQRRGQMSDAITQLRKILPQSSKTNQAHVMTFAVDYIRQIQSRIELLEKENEDLRNTVETPSSSLPTKNEAHHNQNTTIALDLPKLEIHIPQVPMKVKNVYFSAAPFDRFSDSDTSSVESSPQSCNDSDAYSIYSPVEDHFDSLSPRWPNGNHFVQQNLIFPDFSLLSNAEEDWPTDFCL